MGFRCKKCNPGFDQERRLEIHKKFMTMYPRYQNMADQRSIKTDQEGNIIAFLYFRMGICNIIQ